VHPIGSGRQDRPSDDLEPGAQDCQTLPLPCERPGLERSTHHKVLVDYELVVAQQGFIVRALLERFVGADITEADAKYLAQRAYNAHRGKRAYEGKLSRGPGRRRPTLAHVWQQDIRARAGMRC
jgi:hypothetical protein